METMKRFIVVFKTYSTLCWADLFELVQKEFGISREGEEELVDIFICKSVYRSKRELVWSQALSIPPKLHGQELLQVQHWLLKYSPETWPKLKDGTFRLRGHFGFTTKQKEFISVLQALLTVPDLARAFQREFDTKPIKNFEDRIIARCLLAFRRRQSKEYSEYMEKLSTGGLSGIQYDGARKWVEQYAPDAMTTEMRTRKGFKIQLPGTELEVQLLIQRRQRWGTAPAALVPATNCGTTASPFGPQGPVELVDRTRHVLSIAELKTQPLQVEEPKRTCGAVPLFGMVEQLDTTVQRATNDISVQSMAGAALKASEAGAQIGSLEIGGAGQWTPTNGHGASFSIIEDLSKRFVCELCNCRFYNSWSLNNHLDVHSEEQHKCDECGQSFRRQNGLTNHRVVHVQDKPFSCDECGSKFVRKYHLVRHAKIHNKRKMESHHLQTLLLTDKSQQQTSIAPGQSSPADNIIATDTTTLGSAAQRTTVSDHGE